MSNDGRMHLTFRALASPARRQMLDVIKSEPGLSLGGIAAHFDMSRIGVMQHLRVLAEADLVRSVKQGRVRRHFVNAVPIQAIHERWTTEFSALWAGQLTQLKQELEGERAAAAKLEGVLS